MPDDEHPAETSLLSGPPLLSIMIASGASSVGALVDFANTVPADRILPLACALAHSTLLFAGPRPLARRRSLVILGALLNRIIFDIEQVPRHRQGRV